jgi:hypothetical protein
MKYAVTAVAFAGLSLFGCAAPTPEQREKADYGAYPSNYREIIKAEMAGKLKDPYSAQYNFIAGPTRFYKNGLLGGQPVIGYGVCVGINAKNSFGGYVGQAQHFFVIRDGRVVVEHGNSDPGSFDSGLANAFCEKIAKVPEGKPQ